MKPPTPYPQLPLSLAFFVIVRVTITHDHGLLASIESNFPYYFATVSYDTEFSPVFFVSTLCIKLFEFGGR